MQLTIAQLYLYTRHDRAEEGKGHHFAGYYLPYPDAEYEGLVSTISDDPPMLNWIYVDQDTYEVKYGVRSDAQQHVTGPFDCTQQDRRMTLEGWEGFVAVEEFPGTWALYFDRDDDGLVTRVPMGTRVLEVDLYRREKRTAKPSPDEQPKTLDDKMRELKNQDNQVDDEATANDETQRDTGEIGDVGQRAKSETPADRDGTHDHVNTVNTAPSFTTGDDVSDWPISERDSDDGEGLTVASSASDDDETPMQDLMAGRRSTIYKSPYVEDGDASHYPA